MVNMAPASHRRVQDLPRSSHEMGGVFGMRVGAPAAPGAGLSTDDDIVSLHPRAGPFSGLPRAMRFFRIPGRQLWTSRGARKS